MSIKWSDIKDVERRTYRGYKSVDHNYYVDGNKVYCIRFYYESHIMRKKHKITLHRLDFTESWYTGKIN